MMEIPRGQRKGSIGTVRRVQWRMEVVVGKDAGGHRWLEGGAKR